MCVSYTVSAVYGHEKIYEVPKDCANSSSSLLVKVRARPRMSWFSKMTGVDFHSNLSLLKSLTKEPINQLMNTYLKRYYPQGAGI
jgi:hypothetical protein